MQDRDPSSPSKALPALLAALLVVAGTAGAEILTPIAFAFVLLPACEAAIAASDAAEEESALAPWPARPRATRRAPLAPSRPFPAPTSIARKQHGAIDGVQLPLLA